MCALFSQMRRLTEETPYIDIFRHESLTPAQILDRMVHYYKAWCVNSPDGRR